MRKLLTGAVVASASLAIAAGAIAQDPDVQLSAKASPSNAGTKAKPKHTKLTFEMKVEKPGTTVEYIDLRLPKGLKFSGKGLGKGCTPDELYRVGPDFSERCKKSKAGDPGTATAVLEPLGTQLDFKVRPYVQDKNTLLFYVDGVSDVQSPVTGEITNKGRKLRITIPFELRCPGCPPRPPGGNDASLTGLKQTLYAKKGKNYLVSSTGCKGGKHGFTGKLTYSERRDNAPVPPASSTTTTAKCTK